MKIESNAGPSEVVVVADASVPADWVAADLLAQAEHGPGGAAVLVTCDPCGRRRRRRRAGRAHGRSPHAADEIEATMRVMRAGSCSSTGPEQAIDAANAIAPEHLELMCADAEALVPLVRNAGAVFVGPCVAGAVGDYVAGVNHVLPTGRHRPVRLGVARRATSRSTSTS